MTNVKDRASTISPDVTDTLSVSSTSADGEQHKIEVFADPKQNATRRRKASLEGSSQVPSFPGTKAKQGCLLHALLNTQMENRKLSQVIGDAAAEDNEEQSTETHYIYPGKHSRSKSRNSETREWAEDTIQRSPKLDLPPEQGFSRLLTKKQLAEMAFSVRDLSKYLGTLKTRLRVRNVLIVTKIWDSSTIERTKDLTKWLLTCERGPSEYNVYVEDMLKSNGVFNEQEIIGDSVNKKKALQYWNQELCEKHPQRFDLVVTLGGDGTVLYTSRLFQNIVPPVLSFNLGSLGFLTKFDFNDHERIFSRLTDDGVIISLRMRFECTIMRAKKQVEGDERTQSERDLRTELMAIMDERVTHDVGPTYSILNDVVIDRGPRGTMCTAEIYVDDEHLTNVEADGVVIATPTGSTAYSLSAGGSLVHPDIQGMIISPICAHSLSFRPLIVPDNVVLRIGVPYSARTSAWCSFDGKDRVELIQGDYVTISASRFPFPMIQNKKLGSDWFESLSETLNWNQRRAQQKKYDSIA
ncbi:ATP-NAD kinase-like domain-containing protein [Dipodascopsis uninucleata]